MDYDSSALVGRRGHGSWHRQDRKRIWLNCNCDLKKEKEMFTCYFAVTLGFPSTLYFKYIFFKFPSECTEVVVWQSKSMNTLNDDISTNQPGKTGMSCKQYAKK